MTFVEIRSLRLCAVVAFFASAPPFAETVEELSRSSGGHGGHDRVLPRRSTHVTPSADRANDFGGFGAARRVSRFPSRPSFSSSRASSAISSLAPGPRASASRRSRFAIAFAAFFASFFARDFETDKTFEAASEARHTPPASEGAGACEYFFSRFAATAPSRARRLASAAATSSGRGPTLPTAPFGPTRPNPVRTCTSRILHRSARYCALMASARATLFFVASAFSSPSARNVSETRGSATGGIACSYSSAAAPRNTTALRFGNVTVTRFFGFS
mmetsp:Transcript_13764/g.57855  ORF Transcript_13764/g.57855 Transcript_13764/m.57855 type:complete len:274 (+) Transcript_13764:920-1741(+)